MKGSSPAVGVFFPPVLAGSVLYWAGLGYTGFGQALAASSQNTRTLFSPANHNQMCPDLFY